MVALGALPSAPPSARAKIVLTAGVTQKLSASRMMVTAAGLWNRRRCKNNPHNLGTTAALARRNDHEQVINDEGLQFSPVTFCAMMIIVFSSEHATFCAVRMMTVFSSEYATLPP